MLSENSTASKVETFVSSLWLLRAIVLLIIFTSSTYLFYQMATGVYASDLVAHLSSALDANHLHYSFMSLLLSCSYGLCGYYGVACMLATLILLTIIATERLLQFLLPYVRPATLFVMAVLCNFAISIPIPFFQPNVYMGNANGVAWHNSTYIGMRLFALIAIIFYLKIVSQSQRSSSPSQYIAFALSTTISCMTKPSFFVIFAPAVIAEFARDFVRNGWENKEQWMLIVACFVPAVIVVGCQYFVLFAQNATLGGNHIAIGFAVVTSKRNNNLLVYLVRSLAFPLVVLIGHYKDFGSRCHNHYFLAWIMLLIGLLEHMLLYETGNRMYDGNFGWSLKFAIFFVMISSLGVLLNGVHHISWASCNGLISRGNGSEPPSLGNGRYCTCCLAIFTVHAAVGIYFYLSLLMGVAYDAVGGLANEYPESAFWPIVIH